MAPCGEDIQLNLGSAGTRALFFMATNGGSTYIKKKNIMNEYQKYYKSMKYINIINSYIFKKKKKHYNSMNDLMTIAQQLGI